MSTPRFTLTQSRGRTEPDRRTALALLASGAAAALAGCSPPRETATPYVVAPEGGAAGVRRRYATTLTLAGYGLGVTGICIDGRPIKLEGAAHHPASLGATDVFAEAAILDLYDPNRLKAPAGPQGPVDWTTLGETLRAEMVKHTADQGAGLVLVTGRVASPSLLRQIARLQSAYPRMLWSRFEAVHDDHQRAAWGRPVVLRPRYDEADMVLWLGADPLGPGPQQIAAARAVTGRRRPNGADGSRLSRLYAAEATLSQSGVLADHRLTADPATQAAILALIAGRAAALSPRDRRFAEAVAADLQAHPGRALVEVGREHPPEVHALAKAVNARLAAPIDIHDDPDPHPDGHAQSLAKLHQTLAARTCTTLLVMDANPAFHARDLGPLIGRVPFSLWLGGSLDETAKACRWNAPLSHALESWTDARALDGTASLGQPLIRPLYDTRTAAQALALVAGDPNPDEKALVRETWPTLADDLAWRTALSSGVIDAPLPLSRGKGMGAPHSEPASLPALALPPSGGRAEGLTLAFIAHASLWDGRHADNAWLQECPDPITKEVWGSALRLSAVDARRFGLREGDHARLHAQGQAVDLRVTVVKGQAAGVATLPLGGGRSVAGPIGKGVGPDAARLRGPDLAWSVAVDRLERLAGSATPINQASFTLEGETASLAPTLTIAGLAAKAHARPKPSQPTLLPPPAKAAHAWAMVIDTAVCIGCNACVTACQAENNVPVVGPEEIAAGRDMHWLRIDRYDPGPEADDPQTVFSPTPCMQCEDAPCEPVCPVEASVHDHEGLNDQVYNRCVGTRFCQANCPYKVRRFNFRDYQAPRLYPALDAEPLKAQKNPDVTVRGRGVMEKCTYCVQRIAAAKSDSERTGAPIADGSLKTACQSACPTKAITFGDLNDPVARVNAQRLEPRHFTLLEAANTRPRTTYLAKVRNPNPALERPA